jgi:hypothetical protein
MQKICCGQELYDRFSAGVAKLYCIDQANTYMNTLSVEGVAVYLNVAFITFVQ